MKEEIRESVRGFVARIASELAPRSFWREPLVGFIDAADSRLSMLRRVVGESHLLPGDVLPSAGSVVVVFVPFVRQLGCENRQGRLAARSWAEAYVETNRMLAELGKHLQQQLAGRGHTLVVTPATHNFDPERLVSDWSHRHLAVLAGVGKLGHHNLLITEHGCLGRLCSYVTDLPLETDAGPNHEPCLHRAGRTCLRCVQRCVADALREESFDRRACYSQCLDNDGRWPDLGVTDVCGKCLAGLPCSLVDPVGRMKE